MSEFTEGEWINDAFGKILGCNQGKSDQHLANVLHYKTPRGEANARLIAAAPDLYKACEIVEECFRQLSNCEGISTLSKTVLKDNASLIRQILAKAKE